VTGPSTQSSARAERRRNEIAVQRAPAARRAHTGAQPHVPFSSSRAAPCAVRDCHRTALPEIASLQ
jgi:hypothetical protein